MILTITLDGVTFEVEVGFFEDDDGLHIETVKCKSARHIAQDALNDASEREVDAAIWAAHAEAVKESKAP